MAVYRFTRFVEFLTEDARTSVQVVKPCIELFSDRIWILSISSKWKRWKASVSAVRWFASVGAPPRSCLQHLQCDVASHVDAYARFLIRQLRTSNVSLLVPEPFVFLSHLRLPAPSILSFLQTTRQQHNSHSVPISLTRTLYTQRQYRQDDSLLQLGKFMYYALNGCW